MPHNRWVVMILVGVALLIGLASLDQGTSWDGVDIAVVGRFASEAGREPWQPFLNLQGDALLFAFSIAGAIGGFVAGYYWREMFGNGPVASASTIGDTSKKEKASDV